MPRFVHRPRAGGYYSDTVLVKLAELIRCGVRSLPISLFSIASNAERRVRSAPDRWGQTTRHPTPVRIGTGSAECGTAPCGPAPPAIRKLSGHRM